MSQKGVIGTIILIIIGLIVLFFINDIFFAKPYKISGENVITPFKANQIVLAERITYLFTKPTIGDRVIFNPLNKDTYSAHIGIITKVEDQNGVAIYNIVSSVGSHEPWTVSADKISRKIWFPIIDQVETEKIALSLQSAPNPIPSPTSTSNPESSNSTETANWKTYTSSYGYTIKYPQNVEFINCEGHCNYEAQIKTQEVLITLGASGFPLDKNLSDYLYQGFCSPKADIIEEKINNITFYKSEKVYNSDNICLNAVADLNKKTKDSYWILDIQAKAYTQNGVKLFNQILSTFKFIP